MGYGHAGELAGHDRRPDATPIDPALLVAPRMLAALAARDITEVYRRLTESGVSQYEIARRTGQSHSEVCEIIQGGRRVQSVKVLEKIADGLGVPRGWMGLAYDDAVPSHRGEEVTEEMKRRAFVKAAFAGVWGLPTLPGLDKLLPAGPNMPTVPTPLPSRLDPATVDALRALTGRMRSLARFYGGQADTIGEIARSYTRLMTVDGDESVKHSLGSALAELHSVAGWAGFDAHLDDAARYHFGRAFELASDAGDAYGHAYALWLASSLPGERGHPDEALKLLQLGQIALAPAMGDPNAAFMAGWLRAESAFELSRLGRADAARSEMAAARDGWEPPDADEAADMDATAAEMELNLGHLDAAEPFAAVSMRRWEGNPDRRRSALGAITLATIHVQAGEPDGLRLAHRAITSVTQLRSVRARDRLAPLVAALEARPGNDARELAQQARRVVAATA